MFVLSNFLSAVAKILDIVLSAYYWLILIRALISWVNPDPFNPIVQFLYRATDPVLDPIRRLMPRALGFGLDLSPFIAVLAIYFLQSFLVQTIRDFAFRFAH
jgi:YggT family protein